MHGALKYSTVTVIVRKIVLSSSMPFLNEDGSGVVSRTFAICRQCGRGFGRDDIVEFFFVASLMAFTRDSRHDELVREGRQPNVTEQAGAEDDKNAISVKSEQVPDQIVRRRRDLTQLLCIRIFRG